MQHPQNSLWKFFLMTLTQGHNFDLGFFDLGSDLIFDSGSILLFFEFGCWLKVKSWFSTQGRILILFMMTQGQDSFTFGFQWMTLGQEFHLFFFCTIWGHNLIFDWWLWVRDSFWLRGGLLIFEALMIDFGDFFLMCLWSFVHGEVCSWIFLLRWFVEILIVKIFYFGKFFMEFFFKK